MLSDHILIDFRLYSANQIKNNSHDCPMVSCSILLLSMQFLNFKICFSYLKPEMIHFFKLLKPLLNLNNIVFTIKKGRFGNR